MKTCSWLLTAALVVTSGQAATYTVDVVPGLNLIANQLDTPPNDLNTVIPLATVGDTFYKWDSVTQSYVDAAQYLGTGLGWFQSSGPSIIFGPGEAGFYQTTAPQTLTFLGNNPGGSPWVAVTPAGNFYFVGRKDTVIGSYEQTVVTFEHMVGTVPRYCASGNVVFYRYTNFYPTLYENWIPYSYRNTPTGRKWGWSPYAPVQKMGEGAVVVVKTPNGTCPPAASTLLAVSGVVPDSAINVGNVTITMTGCGFQSTDIPFLRKPPLIYGTWNSPPDAKVGVATFNINNVPQGNYRCGVKRGNNMNNWVYFKIYPSGPNLEMLWLGSSFIPQSGQSILKLAYRNVGNAALSGTINLSSSDACVTVSPSSIAIGSLSPSQNYVLSPDITLTANCGGLPMVVTLTATLTVGSSTWIRKLPLYVGLVLAGANAAGPVSHGILGPAGYVTGEEALPYLIGFTNDGPEPLEKIVVYNQPDPILFNLASLSLGPITLGSQTFTPPDGVQSFKATNGNVALEAELVRDPFGIAGLGAGFGPVKWQFTGLGGAALPAAGSVVCNVAPHKNLSTGEMVPTEARAEFTRQGDPNATETSLGQWSNPFDHDGPAVAIEVPTNQISETFPVSWAAVDTGVGVDPTSYSVYVATNDQDYTMVLSNTTNTSLIFTGPTNQTYKFLVAASDFLGNEDESDEAVVGGTILPIPTLSEWGLILLALLLLTVGTLFLVRTQLAPASLGGPGRISLGTLASPPLEGRLLGKVLAVILAAAVAGMMLGRVLAGGMSALDVVGTLLCAIILAYWVHLLILLRKRP